MAMSKATNVHLPNYLHEQVKTLAEREGISINQFIILAVAEKMSALRTVDYLRERAKRGSREEFEQILAKVPDIEPGEHDKL
jgi:hypothetical protein